MFFLKNAIEAFALYGKESAALDLWKELKNIDEAQAFTQEVLESLAWGVLEKGKNALGAEAQLIGILAAALTRDGRAIPFLLHGMRHSNGVIRAISVQLSSLYADQILIDEILALFQKETVSQVRLALIEAFGKLKYKRSLDDLFSIVCNPLKSATEKKAAISSIISIEDHLSRSQVVHLTRRC